MPQERCVPHAIAWRGHNPHQALPEHLVQSYPSLNAHTVGYGPFWENGIPEHLQSANGNSCAIQTKEYSMSHDAPRYDLQGAVSPQKTLGQRLREVDGNLPET